MPALCAGVLPDAEARGVAVFQMPGGRPAVMHYIARELMEEHIRDSGGALLDVVRLGGRRRYPSFRYWTERPIESER